MTDNVVLLRARPCPICGKAPSAAYEPFCSKRCADIDLNRWLSGAYAIPGKPLGEDEDEREGTESSAEDET